jgi:hypothetical protein
VITHPLHPTFIDRAAGKSLVTGKAAAAKKRSEDDQKCCHNGLHLIAMAWCVQRLRFRDTHHDLQDRHPSC